MGALSSCLIGLPILQSVLIPFFVVGLKLDVVAILLKYYERTGNAPNEDKINFIIWGLIFLLLLCAYGLPLLGVILPIELSTVLMALAIAGSILSVYKVCSFRLYHSLYRQILSQAICSVTPNEYNHAEQAISFEPNIYSSKKGADYRQQRVNIAAAKRRNDDGSRPPERTKWIFPDDIKLERC